MPVTVNRILSRRRLVVRLAASLVLLLLTAVAASAEPPQRIILDTDPGVDDAIAILLALNSPELQVEAITVVPGNVTLQRGLENALKLVSLAGRCGVPVAAGAELPLVSKLETAEFWHGQNGLGNVDLPAPTCRPDPRFGPDLIIELVHKYPGEIVLVPVGPLTNIALAVRKDPSIVARVKQVVLMGGSLSGGNETAVAEANIYGDPEAAKIVFSAGWPVTMVGLDVTNRTLFTRAHLTMLRRTRGPQNDFAAAALEFRIERAEEYGIAGSAMHDPLALAVVFDPTLVTTRCLPVDVETRGELTRGKTVADRREGREGGPCAQVALEVEAERAIQLMLARLRDK